jgi:ATP-dependent DNA helicase RecG
LTRAQERAIAEIRADLAAPRPMNRLLQGDVGSGKTVVATAACLIAVESGYQAAFMAPTEILAQQHFRKITELLSRLSKPPRVALLIGSLPEREKEFLRAAIRRGDIDIVIGTHALIQDEVRFKNLGLAVIDEQHRFGVIQRAQLEQKGENLDILVMSATPIPRTITLTLYGQFEISLLDELPFPKNIQTFWVSEDKRDQVYEFVVHELKQGAQAYIVFPLIEESEELDLKAATQAKEELEQTFFQGFRVGLLHGRMSDDDKQAVMKRFVQRELDVLVSTTIIEVGIDVPTATVMVIEHADRFGLAQLHQLRGRIGRAGDKSYCFCDRHAAQRGWTTTITGLPEHSGRLSDRRRRLKDSRARGHARRGAARAGQHVQSCRSHCGSRLDESRARGGVSLGCARPESPVDCGVPATLRGQIRIGASVIGHGQTAHLSH